MDTNHVNRIKHTTVFWGWTAVMLFYLFTHFHKYRLYVFVVAFIYMLYQEIIKIKKTDANSSAIPLTVVMGRGIGVTSLVFLAYYIAPYWPLQFGRDTTPGYATNLFKTLFVITRRNLVLQIGMLILAVLGICRLNPNKYKVLDLIYRYMAVSSICFYIIYAWTGSVRVGVFYFAVTGLFIFNDILRYRIEAVSLKTNRWFIAFSTVLLVLIALEPNAMAKMSEKGYLEYILLGNNFTIINIMVVLAVIAVLEMVFWKYRETTEQISDSFLFLIFGSVLIVCGALYNFYVGYWPLIFVGYITVTLVYLFQKNADVKGFLIISAVAVLGIYEAHNGRVISFTLFAVCIFIIYDRVKILKKQDEDQKFPYVYRLTVMIIIALTIITAGRIYEVRHLMANYRTLIIAALIFAALTVITGFNPGMFHGNKLREQVNCIIFAAAFAVLCVGLTIKGGSKIYIDGLDDEQFEITVDARGKDNTVKNAKQFWLEDPVDMILAEGHKSLPKETELSSFSKETIFSLERSGRLKISVVDKYGIETTAVKWYHVNPYEETIGKDS